MGDTGIKLGQKCQDYPGIRITEGSLYISKLASRICDLMMIVM